MTDSAARAYISGQEAGALGLGSGLNGHPTGSAEFAAWRAGHAAGASVRAVRDAKRTRRSCLGCECGGRALCVGDAQ